MHHIQPVEPAQTGQHRPRPHEVFVTGPLHRTHHVRMLLQQPPAQGRYLAALGRPQHLRPVLDRQAVHAERGERLGQRLRPHLFHSQTDRRDHMHHAPGVRPLGLHRHVLAGFERRAHQGGVRRPAARRHEPLGGRIQHVLPFLTRPGRAASELHQPVRHRPLQHPDESLAHGADGGSGT
ncbi:hypothetical protein [Streptomyces sp. AM8-1-1]|uniref:hypothetical protein n=1 Tax=Streptomyces sp. AM8-1-1 TaxID=3075825 RepID=UPI0028C39BA3|nr:hypothetical protein [Streptomyces sp. AM8-1-1]WNO70117.1 hypothetical protein RPQ07_00010 [Streptomyces sp. AM8-1-1]WNO76998.1 hypothetical protein RPQ07_37715 [Streptomyces sp. AM8-1-1]